MLNMKIYIILILLFIPLLSNSQNNKQNIRGNIIDALSQSPLANAKVIILNDTTKNFYSDVNGNFVIKDLSPERYEVKVSYMGYKNVTIPNVVVSSGKETILDIKMEEDIIFTDEIVVTVNEKDKTINDLVTNSARTFSMEEVNRYSGCRNDPARIG